MNSVMPPNRIAMTLVGLLLLAGCQEKQEAPPEIVRPVLSTVAKVQSAALSTFAGTVQPKVQTALGFRVTGLLVSRDVDTGDVVHQGEQLATLDTTALSLAVGSARADLANATATLANAVSVEQRTRSLLTAGTETQASVENAEQSREAAQSSLVKAKTSLSKAEEQLSYATITAAFDGVVTATGAEVGQVVSTGASVVTVARPDDRDAVVDMPDGAPLPPVGTPFKVSLQVNPAMTVNGKVRETAPAADTVTRTRRVKIALDNPPPSFRLGTTITASALQTAPEQLVVPKTAVLSRDGKTLVWIVDEAAGTVKSVAVTTGPDMGDDVVITHGVDPGMRIVTAGVHMLADGQKVKIEDEDRS